MKPKRTILCVDDNEQSLSYRKIMLETRGYRVASYSRGEEALERFKLGGIDLVVTDMAMPGLDGPQLIAAIKSLSPHTPAILISSKVRIYDHESQADVFLARGMYAPADLLERLLALIERETEHARAGRPARIRAKLNALSDSTVIQALYRASQVGVVVDLVVRGICTLRPGVPGLSERIRVVSILGRFLEHARIYHFGNGGEEEYYIGSADWRPRNLRRRVEVVAPVFDPAARRTLDHILTEELSTRTAWLLRPDGGYDRPEA